MLVKAPKAVKKDKQRSDKIGKKMRNTKNGQKRTKGWKNSDERRK